MYVRRGLREGLFGWEVVDCAVTMTGCDYYVGDGTAKPTMPTSKTSAADFRKLTPIVLMQALERAGTVVCEPVLGADVEVPAQALGAVALGRLARPASWRSADGSAEALRRSRRCCPRPGLKSCNGSSRG